MPLYRTPGVYFERSERPPGIGRRRTDIVGFVGIAEKGPPHRPVRVESWAQFRTIFGGHIPQAYLAYAVQGFFENGGVTCWVVRVCDDTAAPAVLDFVDETGRPVLRLTASSPGTWGERLLVTIVPQAGGRFLLTIRLPDGTQELRRDLSLDRSDPRFVETIVDDPENGSRLVVAAVGAGLGGGVVSPSVAARRRPRATIALLGGGPANGAPPRVGAPPPASDGLAGLTPAHFSGEGAPIDRSWGLATLEAIDEVAVVAVPDLMGKPQLVPRVRPPRAVPCSRLDAETPPPAPPERPVEFPPDFGDDAILAVQHAMIAHCMRLQDRVTVLDPTRATTTPDAVVAWRADFESSYGALYYPWLRVPDPLRLQGLLRPVPPSGHVCGIYARTDLAVGVHKAPANEVVQLAEDVTTIVDDVTHGQLNSDFAVNVVRPYPGRGIRVFGARTLSADPQWRFVNVRRLLLMIEEAIAEGTQWTVFEPDSPRLWGELDRVVRNFLEELWRGGQLDGATAEDAYFVRCDATTNPPEATAQGRMTCLVGVQPPFPAEFVVVRIGKTEGGIAVVEGDGG